MEKDTDLKKEIENLSIEEVIKRLRDQYFDLGKHLRGNNLKGVLPIMKERIMTEKDIAEAIKRIKEWINETKI